MGIFQTEYSKYSYVKTKSKYFWHFWISGQCSISHDTLNLHYMCLKCTFLDEEMKEEKDLSLLWHTEISAQQTSYGSPC